METSGNDVNLPQTISTLDAGVPKAEYPVPGPPGASSQILMYPLLLFNILLDSIELYVGSSLNTDFPLIPRLAKPLSIVTGKH